MTKRMLVIEDDENVRESIAALLEVEGYEVVKAINGAQALSKLRKEPGVSLIVLDLMMPQMDGWSFRARQLNEPGLKDIPVLVLSGAGRLDREHEALDAAGVLAKPVSVHELLDMVERHLVN